MYEDTSPKDTETREAARAPGGESARADDEVVQRELSRPVSAQAWGRTATVAGMIAAVGLCLQSLLFLVDASFLRSNPPFQPTAAGRDQDLATFFGARAQRQHDVLWNIVLRDVLGPVAMIALIVLALAVVQTRARRRPAAQAWALVLVVGALFNALSDLVFLSQLGVWLQSGFIIEPPADMIAVGRTSDQIIDIADMLENAADVTIAAGLLGLAVVLSHRLRLLARALAVVLILSVAAALAGSAPVYGVLSLLGGVVLAPALLIGTGRWVPRAEAE